MRVLIAGIMLFAFAAINVAQGGTVLIIGMLVLLLGAAMLDHRLTQARKVIVDLEAEILELRQREQAPDRVPPSPEALPTMRAFLRTLQNDAGQKPTNGQTPGSSASRQ